MNVPFNQCSVQPMFHSTNVLFNQCSVQPMFHSPMFLRRKYPNPKKCSSIWYQINRKIVNKIRVFTLLVFTLEQYLRFSFKLLCTISPLCLKGFRGPLIKSVCTKFAWCSKRVPLEILHTILLWFSGSFWGPSLVPPDAECCCYALYNYCRK